MEAARRLSGYSLGEADLLRRAMGKKIRSEMEAQRKRFVDGAVERRRREGPGRGDLRTARALCRLRLQQEPRGGLRARRLSDRLHEGELSGRVHGRVDDLRHGQYRQAGGIPRRGAAARRQGRAAFDQPLRRRCSRSRATPSTMRWRRSRASAARRSRRSSRRAATGRSATSRTSPAGSIRARSTSGCWKASRAAGAFDALESNRARAHARRRRRSWRRRSAATRTPKWGRASCSAARRCASSCRCRRRSRGCRRERLQREFDAIGFFLSGHPLDDYAAVLERLKRAALGGVLQFGEAGRDRRPRRRHRGGARRAAHQDRQQDGHPGILRSLRPLRGGDLPGRPAAIPRPARAGPRRCC